MLRVGGGLAADRVLLQAVADLSGLALEVARDLEATARGIAALAAAAVGALDPDAAGHAVAHRVEPRLDAGRPGARARPLARRPRGARAGPGRRVSTGVLDPAARAGGARADAARSASTCSWSAAASPAPASPSTPPSRGLSVALVEARDIAAGTSSRSSKLIHGGLRYLEMLDFGLVREALRERRLLLTRLAPHLVRPVPFLFPLRHRVWERPYMGAGPPALRQHGRRPPRAPGAAPVARRAALRSAPALRPDSLVGAVRFHDAQEDDALFAVYVARTAAAHGAAIATRAAVDRLRARRGRPGGRAREVRDGVGGRDVRRCAPATPWSPVGVGTDRVLELATGRPHHELRPSKGVHVLVPRAAIPMRIGLFMRTEKSIFHAIPVGRGSLAAGRHRHRVGRRAGRARRQPGRRRVRAREGEQACSCGRSSRREVCGVYAGLRPLVAASGAAATTKLSRQHRLFHPLPGLTAIAGGKYTTYRVMARDAVDAAARDLGGGGRGIAHARTCRCSTGGGDEVRGARRRRPGAGRADPAEPGAT